MNKKVWIVSVLVMASGLALSQAQITAQGIRFGAPTVKDQNQVDGEPGDIVFNTTEGIFYGNTSGDTWVPLGGAAAVVHPGTVITFAGETCPHGYLAADGLPVSRETYAALFSVIGITHGQGDGSTTFNVPDYRGRFLRGVDGTAGRDLDKGGRTAMNAGGNTGDNVGSIQPQQVQLHSHSQAAQWEYNYTNTANGGNYNRLWTNNPGFGFIAQTTGATGGNETRPINAYVNYCIRY